MKINFFFLLVGFLLTDFNDCLAYSGEINKATEVKIHSLDDKVYNSKLTMVNMLTFEYNLLAENKTEVNSTSELKFSLSSPKIVRLEINKNRYLLYLNPGDTLDVFINSKLVKDSIRFEGNASLKAKYLLASSKIQAQFMEYKSKPVYEFDTETLLQRFDSLEKSINIFHTLFLRKNSIDLKTAKLLHTIVYLDILSKKVNFLLARFSKNISEGGEVPIELKSSVNKIPLDTTILGLSLPVYSSLISMYLQTMVYAPIISGKNKEEREVSYNRFALIANQFIQSKYKSNDINEYLQAKNIYQELVTKGIYPALDSALSDFKNRWENSQYLNSLQSRYDKWLSASNGVDAPLITGVNQEGKKFDLTEYKGKILYIDVWATWCGPCREEFVWLEKLQSKFKSNDKIAFVYYSIDKDKDVWKRFVKLHPALDGIHINESDTQQVSSFFKNYQVGAIPRYIIIDKSGKIVSLNASKPSSKSIESELMKLF